MKKRLFFLLLLILLSIIYYYHPITCNTKESSEEFEKRVLETNDILTIKGDYLALGIRYASDGRLDDALALLKKFIDQYPNDPEINQFITHYNKFYLKKPNAIIPGFEAKTIDGLATINLNEYKGSVVVLDFWASWCIPCKEEFINLKRLYKRYHENGLVVIGICYDNMDTKKNAEEILAKLQIPWPNVFDGMGDNSPLTIKYGITQLPYNYLVDRTGKIRGVKLRGKTLEKEIAPLFQ